jgi:DNA polymerase
MLLPPDLPSVSSRDLFAYASTLPDPEARARLIHGGQLLDLRERTLTCLACDLWRNPDCHRRVPFEGGASTMFVLGEAPGFHEDRQSRPFVGQSGTLLRSLLADHLPGVTYMLANTVACRPPRNDYAEARRLGADVACGPLVEQALRLSGAWVALAVGGSALAWFRGRSTVCTSSHDTVAGARLRPFWSDLGVLVHTTYHPAYALRKPEARGQIIDDLRRLAQVIRSGSGTPLSPSLAAEFLETFTRPMTVPEREAWTDQFKARGWGMIHSAVLGHQIVVVDDERAKPPMVPPRFGKFPVWYLSELARIAPAARAGVWSLRHLRAVSTIKSQFPLAKVVA